MVAINFEAIEVYTDIAKTEKIVTNEKKGFANAMYLQGRGIAFHALALKIYNSQGEMEYSDEEYELILKIAEAFYAPCFIDALRAYKSAEDKT